MDSNVRIVSAFSWRQPNVETKAVQSTGRPQVPADELGPRVSHSPSGRCSVWAQKALLVQLVPGSLCSQLTHSSSEPSVLKLRLFLPHFQD